MAVKQWWLSQPAPGKNEALIAKSEIEAGAKARKRAYDIKWRAANKDKNKAVQARYEAKLMAKYPGLTYWQAIRRQRKERTGGSR